MLRWMLSIILFCGLLDHSFSQQSDPHILLMTGKVLEGSVTSVDTVYVYYDYEKKNGKVLHRKLDLERVFSVTDEQGEEEIIYQMDTAVGNYFTEKEMRYYIMGEQDAMEGYRANWTVWVGVPTSAAVGYAVSSTIVVFAVPFVYLVAASLPKYKIREGSVSDPELLREPAYILGYERTARSKRLFKSLSSAVVGTAIGFVVGQSLAQ